MYTNNFPECVNCNKSCGTCRLGDKDFCTSCADGENHFLFAGKCLPQCPPGTTRDLKTLRCSQCDVGCKECDLEDNSICIRCESGLSLYGTKCEINCPVDFKKSEDGTVCEPRVYPFDRSFVPFPFIILLVSLFIIGVFCWILTKRRTLILQVFIIQTTTVLQFAIIFSLLKSIAEAQALFIIFNILILIANVLLSLAFSIAFTLQTDDFEFRRWQDNNSKSYKVMRILFTFGSLHLFRMLYCKIFNAQAF